MINSNIKKTNPSNTMTGFKAILMAGSLAITLGGWGLLAADQIQNTVLPQTQTQVQPASNSITNNTQNLRQVTISNSQPRAVTRTRSSR